MAYYVQHLNAAYIHLQSSPTTSVEETHLRVLRLLEANPAMSQRELAEALGVSLGKTNYCLRALLDKGLIKMRNFRNSQNKAAYAYYLTPAGIRRKAGLTTRFLKLKIAEYEALNREIKLLQAEVG
jgi:EPS-associated MarR family transcriptional regulator